MKIGPTVRPGRWIEKKGNDTTGQDRTGQSKSHKGVIFHLFGEKPPLNRFSQKNCTVVAVPDVITCANCWAEIFRGYDFTGGRISSFPIDSFMGLTTVQRYVFRSEDNYRPLKLPLSCEVGPKRWFSGP